LDFKHNGGIDLHVHSIASDGSYHPSELLQMAAHQGLEAISITDHDTLTGTRAAMAGDLPEGLHFITGVEISAQPPIDSGISGSLHILGYGIDPDFPPLVEALAEMQKSRDQRIVHIVDRLNAIDIPLTLQQVLDEVGDGSAGRPHVASAMIKAGIVTDVDEAFDRYLAKGCPAFVSKARLDCERTLDLISEAGGVPVLAHPCLIRTHGEHANETTNPLIRRLAGMGLKGIEVHYPRHSLRDVADLTETAEQLNLLVTGGSDFHGKISPEIQMGCGLGDLHVPFALFETLISRHPGLKTNPRA
jgi:predicted metal-dependent phosphoesterase TrpH